MNKEQNLTRRSYKTKMIKEISTEEWNRGGQNEGQLKVFLKVFKRRLSLVLKSSLTEKEMPLKCISAKYLNVDMLPCNAGMSNG